MNRSAYLTTGLAIKALANLTKADVALHDVDNIPSGPNIFVVNHFTRLETFLLPYHIYNLTNLPVWSLAHSSLFQGGFGKFLNMVGAISTNDPKRDELIVRSLLTGEANWIIFPEGSMVKTKKIMADGKYMVTSSEGMRKPHTGAAALALRSELFRRYLHHKGAGNEEDAGGMLDFLDISSLDRIREKGTNIVPVNVTYYPIRARENVLSNIAARMVKDIPERMVEEIMTEGTMLLSGVDIDVRFGEAIEIAPFFERPKVKAELEKQDLTGFLMSAELQGIMRKLAEEVMQRYMADIYAMTTVNHEHLFASFLRMYPRKRICEIELKKRVFLAASRIGEMDASELFIHKSLEENQSHLLTDDRFGKYDNFLQLALEKGILKREEGFLIIDRSRLSMPLSFHRGRIDNPIEIMANEVEPLKWLRKILISVALQPDFLLRFNLAWYLLKREKRHYVEDYEAYGYGDDLERKSFGKPFLLPGYQTGMGVVLVHSYLAAPEEVKALARHLRRRGVWVYAPRLPGHGTSSHDLAQRTHEEWLEAVESAYILMRNICSKVVICGVSVGASLAFDVASRAPDVAGVIGVCPPLKLQDYSTNFMPAIDVWNRVVKKLRGTDSDPFFEFVADNPHVNYRRNPFTGIREVGDLLEKVEDRLEELNVPALIIQADNDPVVNVKSGRKVFKKIKSADKQYGVFNFDRHVIINGKGAGRVHAMISNFIFHLSKS
jgi:esterase/lipase/1-acyl-sn-glycerol-3-phosphate acyltransferase